MDILLFLSPAHPPPPQRRAHDLLLEAFPVPQNTYLLPGSWRALSAPENLFANPGLQTRPKYFDHPVSGKFTATFGLLFHVYFSKYNISLKKSMISC